MTDNLSCDKVNNTREVSSLIKVQCIELRPTNNPQTEKIGDILYLDPESIFDDCGEWYGEMYKKNSEEILVRHGVYKLNRFHRIAALRPVSREQVKKAEWIWSTGDVYICSSCGEKTHVDECMGTPIYNFCPFCMAPMTDEAVDMVMERLEALKDG